MNKSYHYTECGLDNIFLSNGFECRRMRDCLAVSIHNIDGLHRAIGLYLAISKKDLDKKEIRFLRDELLMSQASLGELLGVGEQTVHRWETGKTVIPKPSEYLLRLIYVEHVSNKNGNISTLLKKIADLEDQINDLSILFIETESGWRSVV